MSQKEERELFRKVSLADEGKEKLLIRLFNILSEPEIFQLVEYVEKNGVGFATQGEGT